MKRHSLGFLLVLAGLFVLLAARSAFAWGVLAPAQTHQHILREAYRLLAADPAFDPKTFPTLEQILACEGVSWVNVEFTGAGTTGLDVSKIAGPGPDSKGNSPFSMHYYNPARGEGGGPAAVKRYFRYLAEGMLTGKREALPKSAAWGAHFLADMHCPYHVNGVSRATAEQILAAADRSGGGDSSVSLGDDVKGRVTLSYLSPVKSLSNNFRTELTRFLKTSEDWFDPWYYNGDSETLMSETSSHIAWESTVNPGTYNLSGHAPGWPAGTKTLDRAVDARSEGTAKLAVWAAGLTRSQLEYFFNIPEPAINQAVRSVYTLWRASFSALEPALETKEEGGLLLVKGSVRNRGGWALEQVELRLTPQDCRLDSGEAIKSLGTLAAGTRSAAAEWKVKTTEKPCRLRLEAAAASAAPDLLYARVEKALEPKPVLTIVPAQASLTKKDRQTFKAYLMGKETRDVLWGIRQGAAGGTITEAGLYSPPAGGGTFTVTARSKKDQKLAGEASVTVAGIFLDPSIAVGSPGTSLSFAAKSSHPPAVQRYDWTFGDGKAASTATVPRASHAYAKSGSYRVTVRLYDGKSGKLVDEASATAKIETGEALLWQREYWDSGKTRVKIEYTCYEKNGRRIQQGTYRAFNQKGRITYDGTYKEGYRGGTWTETSYHPGDMTPRMVKTVTYAADKSQSGTIKEYYEDGKRSLEYSFRKPANAINEITTGLRTFWSQNGRVLDQGSYNLDGKKIGTWKGWNEQGNPTYVENHDTTARTYWSYYDNGKLKDVSSWLKDKQVGTLERYYDTGQIYTRATYSNGKLDGTETFWHKNGRKSSETPFKAGNVDGVITRWTEKGTVWSVDHFKNGQMDGLSTQFHENGRKKWEQVYVKGRSVEETKWDEKGNVTYHKKR